MYITQTHFTYHVIDKQHKYKSLKLLTMEEYFELLPPEIEELIISYSSLEWRGVSKQYKDIANRYLLFDSRFKLIKDDIHVIMWACQNEYIEMVRLLLSCSSIDFGVYKYRAAEIACRNGSTEVVKLLLSYPIFESNKLGFCFVKPSCDGNCAAIVKLLLSDRRIDKHVFSNYIIRWACGQGHIEIVKSLLSDNVFVSSLIQYSGVVDNMIVEASKHGHYEIVKLILEDNRLNPSTRQSYAVKYACGAQHYEIAKLIISDGRFDNTGLIQWACCMGYREIVGFLLTNNKFTNIDPSARNNECIKTVSYGGHTEIVKLLLEDNRVNPAADDNYAVRWASYNNHTETVRLLLSDSRVDISSHPEKSFIMKVAEKGNIMGF